MSPTEDTSPASGKASFRFFCRLASLLATCAAAGIVFALCDKAWTDFDINWDSWLYHIPFAGRLWDITPVSSYVMEQEIEKFYRGFPMLAEWCQGLLWNVTGHPQATNMVCVLSLLLYVLFLKSRFEVPYGWSVIALLGIPLVQAHAASSYVDLPGNLAVSAMILLTWQLFDVPNHLCARFLLPIFLCAMVAANIKFQMLLVVAAVLVPATLRMIWMDQQRQPWDGGRPLIYVFLAGFAALAIFNVPLQNLFWFGNPFYPFHVNAVTPDMTPGIRQPLSPVVYFGHGIPPYRWLMSILELHRSFGTWNIDQGVFDPNQPGNRMGGFCAPYVGAQLLFLLIYCWRHPGRLTWCTLATFAYLTLVASLPSQSHQLRYYMFWMIILVSFNLILWQREPSDHLRRLGLVSNAAIFVMVSYLTKGIFLLPQGVTLEHVPEHFISSSKTHPRMAINMKLLNHIPTGGGVCLIGQQPVTYLYANYWHPPLKYTVVARWDGDRCNYMDIDTNHPNTNTRDNAPGQHREND